VTVAAFEKRPTDNATGNDSCQKLDAPVQTAPFNGTRFFDADPQVVVQLHRNDAPQCWTSSFAASGTTVNDASRLKAKASF